VAAPARPASWEPFHGRGRFGRERVVDGEAQVASFGLDTAHLESPLVVGTFERAIGADDGRKRAGPACHGEELGSRVVGIATRMAETHGIRDARRLDHDHPGRALATEVEGRAIGGAAPRSHRLAHRHRTIAVRLQIERRAYGDERRTHRQPSLPIGALRHQCLISLLSRVSRPGSPVGPRRAALSLWWRL
jgi:hypothetical protein